MGEREYYAALRIAYLGQQERAGGLYPLDMFNDLLTGTTFLRRPFESLEQAIERIRRPYRKEIDR